MAQAGVREVELFCSRRHLDYRNRAQIDELKYWFRSSDMRAVALYSPMFGDESENRDSIIRITELEKAQRIRATDEIRRALEIADAIPFRYLIQPVGLPGEEFDQDRADAAFNALDELWVFARQLEAEVLIENRLNGFSSAERLRIFLGMTHLPVGYCFDTGTAAAGDGFENEFEKMKERVRAVHLSELEGESLRKRMPFSVSQIDWDRAMPRLRELSAETPFVLDADEDPSEPEPLDALKSVFDRLEEAAEHER